VEDEARMALEPGADLGMLVRGISRATRTRHKSRPSDFKAVTESSSPAKLRGKSAPSNAVVHDILQWHPHAPIPGEICTGLARNLGRAFQVGQAIHLVEPSLFNSSKSFARRVNTAR
jgi:hypothetical protein